VRVGVIGTGVGTRAVAPAFEATEGCTVVALVSPRDEDAVAALCARDDVDLISVHSPPFLDRDHVDRAVEHGLFRIEPWPAHHSTEMPPWVALVRDAVRDGYPFPDMPSFGDGLACARVMDQLIGLR
jgi:hypothetical protein